MQDGNRRSNPFPCVRRRSLPQQLHPSFFSSQRCTTSHTSSEEEENTWLARRGHKHKEPPLVRDGTFSSPTAQRLFSFREFLRRRPNHQVHQAARFVKTPDRGDVWGRAAAGDRNVKDIGTDTTRKTSLERTRRERCTSRDVLKRQWV